jgi:hypothetical protein
MSISKLLKMLALGKMLSSGTFKFHRLLSELAAVVILAMITSMLICASIAAGLCFAYQELLLRGMDRYTSIETVAMIMTLLILIFAIWTAVCWRRLGRLSRRMMSSEAPIAERISQVTHSFIDGFFHENPDL